MRCTFRMLKVHAHGYCKVLRNREGCFVGGILRASVQKWCGSDGS